MSLWNFLSLWHTYSFGGQGHPFIFKFNLYLMPTLIDTWYLQPPLCHWHPGDPQGRFQNKINIIMIIIMIIINIIIINISSRSIIIIIVTVISIILTISTSSLYSSLSSLLSLSSPSSSSSPYHVDLDRSDLASIQLTSSSSSSSLSLSLQSVSMNQSLMEGGL